MNETQNKRLDEKAVEAAGAAICIAMLAILIFGMIAPLILIGIFESINKKKPIKPLSFDEKMAEWEKEGHELWNDWGQMDYARKCRRRRPPNKEEIDEAYEKEMKEYPEKLKLWKFNADVEKGGWVIIATVWCIISWAIFVWFHVGYKGH
jgi:hypothetical protein